MLLTYQTINAYGKDEFEINKSHFICHAQQVASELDAKNFINGIKNLHKDATHNCSAYIIGDQDEYQKADDDGEPSGTAGRPILETLKKLNLKYTAVVITRYFGGVKLGAGGLIRAYGKGAGLAVQSAGIIERNLFHKCILEFNYPFIGAIESQLRRLNYPIDNIVFLEKVLLTVLTPYHQETNLVSLINDLTAGQATILINGTRYLDTPLKGETYV